MEKIQKLWQEIIKNETLIDALFSNVRHKNKTSYHQVKVKPVLIKNELWYQLEYVFEKKVTHHNLLPGELISRNETN